MKFCQPHWDQLRAAIEARGLTPMVPSDGAEAVAKLASEAERGSTLETYDPLMAAHNMIVGNALRLVGLSVMVGDRCPICYLDELHKQRCTDPHCVVGSSYAVWIDKAADEARAHVQSLADAATKQ